MTTPETKMPAYTAEETALLNVLKEIHATELSYREMTQTQLDFIQKNANPSKSNATKLATYLQPYCTIVNPIPPVFSSDIDKTLAQTNGSFDTTVSKICDEMLENITILGDAYTSAASDYNALNEFFIKTHSRETIEAAYTQKELKRHNPNELTMLPIQRFPRYAGLLTEMLKKAKALNEKKPGSVSPATIKKIETTLEAVTKFGSQLNEKTGKPKESISANDQKIMGLLQNMSITWPDYFAGNMAKIIEIIKTKGPEDILKVLSDPASGFRIKDEKDATKKGALLLRMQKN